MSNEHRVTEEDSGRLVLSPPKELKVYLSNLGSIRPKAELMSLLSEIGVIV